MKKERIALVFGTFAPLHPLIANQKKVILLVAKITKLQLVKHLLQLKKRHQQHP